MSGPGSFGAARRRAQLIGTLLVLASAVGFGIAGTISRLAAEAGVSTIGFITWRAVLASVVIVALLVPMVLIGRTVLPRRRQLARIDVTLLAVVTAIAAMVNLAMFIAFSRVPIGVAMICFYLYPGIVTLGAVRIYHEPLDRRRGSALLVGFGGLVLVLAPSIAASVSGIDLVGVSLALAAAVLQAANVLMMGRGFGAIPTTVTAFALNAVSAVAYLAIALIVGPAAASLAVPGDHALLLVVVAGTVAAAAPTLASVAGIRMLGSARSAILMMLEAVVGVTMAAIFLSERPAPIQVLGGAAVLVAGAILQLPRRGEPVLAERVHPTV
jgi:drug/metabolite transporter (DMT)-like permease